MIAPWGQQGGVPLAGKTWKERRRCNHLAACTLAWGLALLATGPLPAKAVVKWGKCNLFCEESVLVMVYNNSSIQPEVFVQRSLKDDPEVVEAAAKKVANGNSASVDRFILEYFWPMNADVYEADLPDWTKDLDFAKDINKDPNSLTYLWATDLNRAWQEVYFQTIPDVHFSPHWDRYSSMPVPRPFVASSTVDFTQYPFETYFINKGLLADHMPDTALANLLNVVDIVNYLKIVPNGFRTYYGKISSPPLLSSMVEDYLHATYPGGDHAGWFEKYPQVIDALNIVWEWWDTNRKVTLNPKGEGETCPHTLNVYNSSSHESYPRQYAWHNDTKLAAHYNVPEAEKPDFYRMLRATTESSWGFSTRWMKDGKLYIDKMVPTDLNTFLYRHENAMAKFASAVGNDTEAKTWSMRADCRQQMIEKYLWSSDNAKWYDYSIPEGKHLVRETIASYVPLWMGTDGLSTGRMESVVASMQKSGLIQNGGLCATKEQSIDGSADFPWVLPTFQFIVMEAMRLFPKSVKNAEETSQHLAERLLSSIFHGWNNTGNFYARFDATHPGKGSRKNNLDLNYESLPEWSQTRSKGVWQDLQDRRAALRAEKTEKWEASSLRPHGILSRLMGRPAGEQGKLTKGPGLVSSMWTSMRERNRSPYGTKEEEEGAGKGVGGAAPPPFEPTEKEWKCHNPGNRFVYSSTAGISMYILKEYSTQIDHYGKLHQLEIILMLCSASVLILLVSLWCWCLDKATYRRLLKRATGNITTQSSGMGASGEDWVSVNFRPGDRPSGQGSSSTDNFGFQGTTPQVLSVHSERTRLLS